MTDWISMQDSSPDDSGDYLYYFPPYESWQSGYGVASYFYGFKLWGTGCSDRITHWMPLPAPPINKDAEQNLGQEHWAAQLDADREYIDEQTNGEYPWK